MNRKSFGVVGALMAAVMVAASPAAALSSRTAAEPSIPAAEARILPAHVGSPTASSPIVPTTGHRALTSAGTSEPAGDLFIASTENDDQIPATPPGWMVWWYMTQPFTPSLAWGSDPSSPTTDNDDVFAIWLEAGESFDIFIDGPDDPMTDFDLYVYPPGSTSFDDDCFFDGNETSDEELGLDIIAEGWWFVRVNAFRGAGSYDMWWDFSSVDDEIPGSPLTSSPVTAFLYAASNSDDVYRVWLNAGDTMTTRLEVKMLVPSGTSAGFNPELHIFGPSATSVYTDAPLASVTGASPRTLQYTAPQSGYYYIDVYQPGEGWWAMYEYGHYTLQCAGFRQPPQLAPVYRFYNFTNNTHFFTDNPAERDHIIRTWPHIYTYESVAYYTNPANNTQPLYRFYNRVSQSHFYTASASEAANVMAKWPHVFTPEGQTYAVSPGWVLNSIPVYRFYNLKNSSHFFTASVTERDIVIARWSNVYQYEGPVFYLGQ